MTEKTLEERVNEKIAELAATLAELSGGFDSTQAKLASADRAYDILQGRYQRLREFLSGGALKEFDSRERNR